MPSPVGHSLMGYLIYGVASRPRTVRKLPLYQWPLILLYLFSANAPDLDFIPGFLVGHPNQYHHGISHSIGFALLFALTFSFLLILLKRDNFGKNFAVLFCLYFSHIVLDYLSIDNSLPYGEPLFWPLSNTYYIAPFAFLPAIQRASSGSGFIQSLFSAHNLWAASVESLLLVPFILLVLTLKRDADKTWKRK